MAYSSLWSTITIMAHIVGKGLLDIRGIHKVSKITRFFPYHTPHAIKKGEKIIVIWQPTSQTATTCKPIHSLSISPKNFPQNIRCFSMFLTEKIDFACFKSLAHIACISSYPKHPLLISTNDKDEDPISDRCSCFSPHNQHSIFASNGMLVIREITPCICYIYNCKAHRHLGKSCHRKKSARLQ